VRFTQSFELELLIFFCFACLDLFSFFRSAFEGQEKTVILPYSNLSYFYGEYSFVRKSQDVEDHASLTTFKRAIKQLKQYLLKEEGAVLKLSGGKGHLKKCDILCCNAEQLLQANALKHCQKHKL
jgi:hypothetical protein